jgi:hypothetical protein
MLRSGVDIVNMSGYVDVDDGNIGNHGISGFEDFRI